MLEESQETSWSMTTFSGSLTDLEISVLLPSFKVMEVEATNYEV